MSDKGAIPKRSQFRGQDERGVSGENGMRKMRECKRPSRVADQDPRPHRSHRSDLCAVPKGRLRRRQATSHADKICVTLTNLIRWWEHLTDPGKDEAPGPRRSEHVAEMRAQGTLPRTAQQPFHQGHKERRVHKEDV